MAKCVLSSTRGVQNTGVSTAGATQFWWLGSTTVFPSTTEAQREVTWRTPGTLTDLYVRVPTNSTSASSTVLVRKNGADDALTVTVGAGATGVFEDTTNNVTVADGDELCYKTVSGGTGTFTLSIASVVFNATTNCVARHIMEGYSVTTNATLFIPIAGDRSGTTGTESAVEITIKKAGIAKNAFLFVQSNARVNNTTWTLRQNRADTAIVLTVGAGATGIFEDTTNDISYAVDDEINWEISSGAGTDALSFHSLGIDYETTTDVGMIAAGSVGTTADMAIAANLTRYITLGGSFFPETTEANVKQKLRLTTNLSMMTVRISPNTTTATSTFTLRKNGAAGNQTVSIGSGATGFFTDTTNSDDVIPTDELNYEIVTGATGTSLTVNKITIWTTTTSLTRVSASFTHIYHVRELVSQSYTHIYNVQGRVSAAYTHIYHLRARVSQQYTHIYGIRARVSQSYTHIYDIRTRVTASYTIRYNIRILVSQTYTHLYNMTGRVTQSYTFRYNILSDIPSADIPIEPQQFIPGLGPARKRKGRQKGYRAIEEELRQEHDKQRRLFRPRVPIPAPLRVIKEPTQVVAEDDGVRNVVYCSIELPLLKLENIAVANIDLVREPWPVIATASVRVRDRDRDSQSDSPRATANIRVALDYNNNSANTDGIVIEEKTSNNATGKMIDQIKQAKIVKLLTLVQLFQLASKL